MSRELQSRCQRLVDQLKLPQPFSLEIFLRHLEKRRQRPIHLLPLPHAVAVSGPCGLWIATATEDFIFFEEDTTPLHRAHIIAHEIAHLVCADVDPGSAPSLDVVQLLPHLDPRLVQRALGRTCYTEEHEREAEVIASLIIDHATKSALADGPGALGRLEEVLGSRRHRPTNG